jgi:predicted Fe-Mo cluster-binding NifX family protein
MLVAYSVDRQGPDSLLDGRFGRCPFFALVDEEHDQVEFVANSGVDAAIGAGTGAAQQLLDREVAAVVTGQVGPKAFEILAAADISVFLAPAGLSLAAARERQRAGRLQRYQIQRF